MKNKNQFLSIIATALIAVSCTTPTDKEVLIIPKPTSMELTQGSFMVSSATAIVVTTHNESLMAEANYLAGVLEPIIGFKPDINDNGQGIIISIDTALASEAYKLEVETESVEISASTSDGIFYGIQTLLQVLASTNTQVADVVELPCLVITDAPAYKWRGMHLDVGRHFFPPSYIKEFIDHLAALKINIFHWHLTEDQGWRIEIKKYPKLTEVGAWRTEDDGSLYGGFYTQEEIKEIVAYATAKHITIVPEIEMPGHATAAVFAYPEYGCTVNGPERIPTAGGIYKDVFNPGKEETFGFLEDILDEVIALFPSEYIHIGGDECPKEQWKNNALCQQRMKDEDLKDEDELQSYFTKRIAKYLQSKDKKIVGWDEILEGGLAPGAMVMSWQGYDGGIEAAKERHEVVMTPIEHVYFNRQFEMRPVYDFSPIPTELDAEYHQYIIGGQACLWTEYIPSKEDVEYRTFPNLFALSEALWTDDENKDYDDFKYRVLHLINQYIDRGINVKIPIPEDVKAKNISFTSTNFSLENPLPSDMAQIFYTLDGSEPNQSSVLYVKPIAIKTTTTVKAKLYLQSGKPSETVATTIFVLDKEKNGIQCEYFEGEWIELPDFNTLEPVWVKKVFDITHTVAEDREDYFALRFKGYIEVDSTQEYTFYVKSDDGSRIFINDTLVVEYDGLHGANVRTGNISLKEGKHKIVVEYFENKGGESLEVGMVNKAGENMPLDMSWVTENR